MIYYILFLYGVTVIIVKSLLFKPVREFFKDKIFFLYKLLNCMLCVPFWVSLLTLFFIYNNINQFFLSDNKFINFIMFGFFSSGVTWLIYMLQLFLTNNNDEYRSL